MNPEKIKKEKLEKPLKKTGRNPVKVYTVTYLWGIAHVLRDRVATHHILVNPKYLRSYVSDSLWGWSSNVMKFYLSRGCFLADFSGSWGLPPKFCWRAANKAFHMVVGHILLSLETKGRCTR